MEVAEVESKTKPLTADQQSSIDKAVAAFRKALIGAVTEERYGDVSATAAVKAGKIVGLPRIRIEYTEA